MKNITGIGGFFFRANDPKAVKDWYINALGIDVQEMVWQQQAGPTVLETFKKDSEAFDLGKQWMLNFRVTDLKALIQDLESKGIVVEQKEEWNAMPEYGTFARIQDPEGNPVELWEPAKE